MKTNMAKQIRKITKKITRKINKSAKQNPVTTVAAAAAITATSTIGTATVITGLIHLPGAVKKRFAKVNLGDNNTDNNNNADEE